jgi:hypothetical protein
MFYGIATLLLLALVLNLHAALQFSYCQSVESMNGDYATNKSTFVDLAAWDSLPPGKSEMRSPSLHFAMKLVNGSSITDDGQWEAAVEAMGEYWHIHADLQRSAKGIMTGIAMQEQLKCLNLLRISTLQVHNITQKKDGPPFHLVQRCLGHLRQSILCGADTTVEPVPRIVGGDGKISTGVTDGIGVLHRCMTWV